ncbi:MAG: hypothetical protein K2M46_07065 [Lachnospiraceae bacterium]|nr:hypothetical protein [Lachnospiraceae bacterium]
MKRFSIILTIACMLSIVGCTADTSTSTADSVSNKNYIANINSGKLHSIHCDSLPYEQNRIYFSTIEEAYEAGYTDKHRECLGD